MPRIRKRDAKAAVSAYCSELGESFVPKVIDFELCPYLPLDDHHDIEVAGYVVHENDGMRHVNVILWRVPDSRRPSSAHELMRVTLVPNGPGVVREVCDWARSPGVDMRLPLRRYPCCGMRGLARVTRGMRAEARRWMRRTLGRIYRLA